MKIIYSFLLLFIAATCFSQETFYNFQALTIDSNMLSMSQYAGKKVMVVNTASYCAYTPQYADLEQLYQQYHQYNFEIIGFPCNDFGSQEPGNDHQIDSFCTATYSVTFQMMSKVAVISTDTADVYKWLQLASRNGVADAPVTWNFNKFLIDENGHWIAHYPSATSPLSSAITNWIMTPAAIESGQAAFSAVYLSDNPVTDRMRLNIVPRVSSQVTIKLFSVDGRLAGNLYDGNISGKTEFNFNTARLQNGIYFLNVSSGNEMKVLKVVLTR
jgi:glutathione peroxidase